MEGNPLLNVQILSHSLWSQGFPHAPNLLFLECSALPLVAASIAAPHSVVLVPAYWASFFALVLRAHKLRARSSFPWSLELIIIAPTQDLRSDSFRLNSEAVWVIHMTLTSNNGSVSQTEAHVFSTVCALLKVSVLGISTSFWTPRVKESVPRCPAVYPRSPCAKCPDITALPMGMDRQIRLLPTLHPTILLL